MGFYGVLALVLASFYSGTVFQTGIIDRPVLDKLDEQELLHLFRAAFKNDFIFQPMFAVLAILFGSVQFLSTYRLWYLIGCVLLAINIAFSRLIMVPHGNEIMKIEARNGNVKTAHMIKKFASLYIIPNLFSILAIITFVFGVFED